MAQMEVQKVEDRKLVAEDGEEVTLEVVTGVIDFGYPRGGGMVEFQDGLYSYRTKGQDVLDFERTGDGNYKRLDGKIFGQV